MENTELLRSTYLFHGITCRYLSDLSGVTEETVFLPGQHVYDVD
jgi:hypothetical protein